MGIFTVLVVILMFATGAAASVFLCRALFHRRRPASVSGNLTRIESTGSCLKLLPACWVVVKRRDLMSVQMALSLHHPRLCTWMEGLTNADGLFIAPPIKGWILIVGGRLPNPWLDVDACFRFVLDLSHKLGKVQLFSAHSNSLRHAWVMSEAGRVVRAYAWAGRTVWNQGALTKAETELHLTCLNYGEEPPCDCEELLEANLFKVPLLAARWGLDPTRIRQHVVLKEQGVAGEPAHRY